MHPHHEKPSEDPPSPPPAAPSLSERIRRRAETFHPVVWPVGLGALGLAGAALLHLVDPNEPGNYPTCPWLLFTGTFCPGCGSMRAIALLTHGEVLASISMNPLAWLLAPYIVWTYTLWLVRTVRPPTKPPKLTPGWFLWGLLIVITGHWVLRNLPWFSFLAPGTPLFPGW
ncbi:DUF2752 domain-containing protein [Nocardiopsis quinghaiensis]|uniref:DUF2752 domain-containing protein n=1 Tax=Nocardiopsis quinghaiensis TaxID=464995 RepID=UPI001681A2FD|nr:DUF2752 domain-containing protein [Nocardiopsis quinghaiensis]